jgi:hypothetical protein
LFVHCNQVYQSCFARYSGLNNDYEAQSNCNKYLSYDFHHPVSHKRSVAKTLLQRAESLQSNSDSQANEREYVLNILGDNDYPKRFLNDCLRSPVCRNQNNSEGDTSVRGYAIVPYIQGVTEPIKRILSNCNIKVVLKPYLTLGHIFAKPKDPVKTNQIFYILYHAVTARKSIWVSLNASLVHG